jgi:hypothetical protein
MGPQERPEGITEKFLCIVSKRPPGRFFYWKLEDKAFRNTASAG